MFYLLRNKNIRKLILSASVSRFGDSVETISFSWLVYQLTGSLSLMGLVFAINFIPNILFAPFAGVYADRHNRKKIVVFSDLFRGLNATLISLLIFNDSATILIIIGFSFVNSTLESFANPARHALYADLIDSTSFLEVTAIASSSSSAAELLGLGTAGIIVAFGGNGMAFAVDAGTFFLSAFAIARLITPPRPPQQTNIGQTYFKDIQVGFEFLLHDHLMMICIAASALLNFFFTPINVLLPKYSDEVLHMGVYGVSLIESSMTLGIIFGGIMVAKLGKKGKLSTMSISGFSILGLSYLLLGLLPVFHFSNRFSLYSALAISFTFGVAVPTISAPIRTHIMRVIPSDKRGIISAVMGTTLLMAIPLGGALVGVIGDRLTLHGYFFSAAIGIFMLAGFLFTNHSYREI
ncbi:MFS transporter [Gottschalkiaceae bacterium SANA]|nr:MFS transporter [Gottschalkiaceae bacterium SANA]